MRYILWWDQVKESQKSQQAAKLSILVNAFLKTPIQKRQALHRRPSIFILPYFHASIFHTSDVVVLDFSGFSYALDLRNRTIGRPGFSVTTLWQRGSFFSKVYNMYEFFLKSNFWDFLDREMLFWIFDGSKNVPCSNKNKTTINNGGQAVPGKA